MEKHELFIFTHETTAIGWNWSTPTNTPLFSSAPLYRFPHMSEHLFYHPPPTIARVFFSLALPSSLTTLGSTYESSYLYPHIIHVQYIIILCTTVADSTETGQERRGDASLPFLCCGVSGTRVWSLSMRDHDDPPPLLLLGSPESLTTHEYGQLLPGSIRRGVVLSSRAKRWGLISILLRIAKGRKMSTDSDYMAALRLKPSCCCSPPGRRAAAPCRPPILRTLLLKRYTYDTRVLFGAARPSVIRRRCKSSTMYVPH